MERNYGRTKFWQLHQRMYNDLRGKEFKYFLQILDDMKLIEGFYPRVINQFNDCGAGLLNIIVHEDLHNILTREGCAKVNINGYSYWRKNWLDLCFISTKDYLERVKYSCPVIPEARWRKGKNMSSGVSTVLTTTYTRNGGTILMVENSLLIHTGQQSQMKPHRKGYYSHL
jgi:hypothetical protein